MRRLVIDTNIYIDWLNRRLHEEVLFQRGTLKYLSAIVQMELRAGALSLRDRRLVRRVEIPFEKVGRILTPTPGVLAEAGDLLRRLQVEHDYDPAGRHSIVGDVLIALSARSIGATVVTQNERDYRAIQSIRRFQLLTVV